MDGKKVKEYTIKVYELRGKHELMYKFRVMGDKKKAKREAIAVLQKYRKVYPLAQFFAIAFVMRDGQWKQDGSIGEIRL